MDKKDELKSAHDEVKKAAVLDAHPHIVMANEFDTLARFSVGADHALGGGHTQSAASTSSSRRNSSGRSCGPGRGSVPPSLRPPHAVPQHPFKTHAS